MATTETIPQTEPERVELRPKVLKKTYVRVMTECAESGKTQGEVIDRLVEIAFSQTPAGSSGNDSAAAS